MADQKISQLSSGAPAQAGDEYVVARSGANYKLTGSNVAALVAGTANTFSATQTFSNPVEFADGSASAPAVTNTGDTNTGVYFPAADEMAVTTGGTVAAAFNSNGIFFRNRIINGDMRIAQRGTAAVTTSNAFPVDRFRIPNGTDGAFSAQQDSSAPTGFINSLKYTVTTADTNLTTVQTTGIVHPIEGTNIADFGWGTANARTVTLSFWVRSSLTGTFSGSLRNGNVTRSYPFTYSISVADTWEYKTVIITGDTSGTWTTDTSAGLYIFFSCGGGPDTTGTAGSWASANYSTATGTVSVIGTLNATFYVTGVQLETGSVATPFERRPYGTELMLCQRYYYRAFPGAVTKLLGTTGYVSSATSYRALGNFPVPMRVAPSALETTGTANQYQIVTGVSAFTPTALAHAGLTTDMYWMVDVTSSGMTSADAGHFRTDSTNGVTAYLGWSAEL